MVAGHSSMEGRYSAGGSSCASILSSQSPRAPLLALSCSPSLPQSPRLLTVGDEEPTGEKPGSTLTAGSHRHFSAPRAPPAAVHVLPFRLRPRDLNNDASVRPICARKRVLGHAGSGKIVDCYLEESCISSLGGGTAALRPTSERAHRAISCRISLFHLPLLLGTQWDK